MDRMRFLHLHGEATVALAGRGALGVDGVWTELAVAQIEDGALAAANPEVIVGGDDDGGAELVEFLEDFNDRAGVAAIEVAGGFVGEDEGGRADDGAGDAGALLFAAGELFGVAISFVEEADELEGGQEAALHFGPATAPGHEHKADVFGDGAPGDEAIVLKDDADASPQVGKAIAAQFGHVFAVDDRAAAIELFFAVEDFEEG